MTTDKRLLNVPNLITGLRLLLAPAVVYLLTQKAYSYAFSVFLIAAVSDALDGFLARHLNQGTPFGALLDAIADKLMILSSLGMLAWLSLLPPWAALAIFARDGLVAAGALAQRYLSGRRGVAPSLLGKLHTALEFVVITVVLAHAAAFVDASAWLSGLFALVCLSALSSGLHYGWTLGRAAAG